MAIDYDELRKIALNFPEVKSLMEERKQIEQDGKAKGNYIKPSSQLTPMNDKFHPKIHKYDKSKNSAIQKITQERLKDNARKIEKAIHKNLKKGHIEEYSKNYKEMKPDELVVFLEKGHEKVLENRKVEKSKKEFDKVQDGFNKKIEEKREKEPITQKAEVTHEKNINDRLQKAYEKMKKERELQENKRDIEQDRGYSR